MDKKNLGVCVTGSFCTFEKTLKVLKNLKNDYNLFPTISYSVRDFDTRFYKASDFKKDLEDVCQNKVFDSIIMAETIGPRNFLDAMIVLPTTGNTLSKLANAITDTPVTMAVKAHSRNLQPTLICVSTNDGLAASLQNIATLYNKKHFYISPFLQDDPIKKPNSLVVDFDKIYDAIIFAIQGKQIQPIT